VKALILSTQSADAASAKRRLDAYARHLRDRGVAAEFAPQAARRRTRAGAAAAAAAGAVTRLGKILGAGGFDVVVVHRRLLPGGDALALRLLERSKAPWVFDLDEALHLGEDASPDADALAAGAAVVLAGSDALAEWARARGAKDVRVQPTPVDTDVFHPPAKPTIGGAGIVGWIGTPETSRFLRPLRAALGRLGHLRRYTLRVVGAGAPVEVPGVNTVERPFDAEDEPEEYRALDVGLFPSPDDEESRCRPAYEALACMASGAVPVVSPVGETAKVVAHGVRGFHATTDEEWVGCVDKLLQDPELRVETSVRGRSFVEAQYSVRALQGRFADALFDAAKSR
jgi:glycosyltransferase involved in cell wall biosynthesis